MSACARVLTPCTEAAFPLAEIRSPSHSPNPSLCISESYLIASAGPLAPPGGASPQGPVINILIYITAGPVTNTYRYAPHGWSPTRKLENINAGPAQDLSPIYGYAVTRYIPKIYLKYTWLISGIWKFKKVYQAYTWLIPGIWQFKKEYTFYIKI